MATEHLKFVIEGDVKEAMSATNQMIHGMDKVGQAVKKLDKEAGTIGGLRAFRDNQIRMRDALAKNDTQLASFNRSIAKTEMQIRRMTTVGVSGMSRLSKSSGAANFAVLSLSQGVQDASFGFIGIQNNITQFIQSFTQLKQETKSTKLAFKALGSTLLGPGGIFLAISAVISAFTYFSMRNRTATKEVKKLDDAVKSLRDSLQSVADTQGNATIKTAEQIAKLNTLYSIATDVNRSMKERIDSAGKLQDELSDTFGSISKVNIISGEAAKTFDVLTQNILKAAKAAAAFQQIVDNIKAIGKAQKEINNARDPDKLKKLTENYIKAQKAFEASRGGTGILSQVTVKRSKDLEKARDALNNYSSGFSKYLDIISDAREENEKLTESINGLNLSFDETKTKPTNAKLLSNQLSVLEEFDKQLNLIKKRSDTFNWGPDKEQEENIKAYHDILDSLIEAGMEGTDVFNKLREVWLAMSVKSIDIAPISPDSINRLQKIADELRSQLRDQINTISFKGELTGASELDQLQDRAKAVLNTIMTARKEGIQPQNMQSLITEYTTLQTHIDQIGQLQQKNKEFTDQWQNIAEGLGGIFEQVFQNAAGGEDVFKSLANAAKRLAVQLAASAAAAKVISSISGNSFQSVLGGMNRGRGGGLLSVLGGFTGLPFFANGGFVNSPTLAVVGDDNTGGEWILNQDQMGALLNSRQQTVRVTGEFIQRGNDLVAVIDSQNLINENT